MSNSINELQLKLEGYKRKFFAGQILRGLLVTGLAVGLSLLAILTIEHFFWVGKISRGLMFFGLIFLGVYLGSLRVVLPILRLSGIYRPLGDQDAARMLGRDNQDVEDRLLNALQLKEALSQNSNQLVEASLSQKTEQLRSVNFSESISWAQQRRLALYFSIPFSIALFLLIFNPSFFTGSGSRIINFHQEFAPPAPFDFDFGRIPDHSFRNEDLEIIMTVRGDVLPESSFVWVNGDRKKNDKGRRWFFPG